MRLLKSLGLHFEYEVTEAPGHAIELAQTAARKGYEMVVSVGGDGTINEVVNGLHNAGSAGNITLGVISTGTGSDYIRSVGISPQYEEACQHLLSPRKLTVDLGIVDFKNNGQMRHRLFVNFAGLGFDAEVVKATTQKFKRLGGLPSYLLATLTTFLFYQNREVSLNIDGHADTRKVCTIIMSHGKYGGGKMLVAPNADPRDGYFDVLVIGDLGKLDLLCSLPRVYRGTHLTHPKVFMKRAREIVIQSAQRMFLQADGEFLGEAPSTFRVLPSALTLAV